MHVHAHVAACAVPPCWLSVKSCMLHNLAMRSTQGTETEATRCDLRGEPRLPPDFCGSLCPDRGVEPSHPSPSSTTAVAKPLAQQSTCTRRCQRSAALRKFALGDVCVCVTRRRPTSFKTPVPIGVQTASASPPVQRSRTSESAWAVVVAKALGGTNTEQTCVCVCR